MTLTARAKTWCLALCTFPSTPTSERTCARVHPPLLEPSPGTGDLHEPNHITLPPYGVRRNVSVGCLGSGHVLGKARPDSVNQLNLEDRRTKCDSCAGQNTATTMLFAHHSELAPIGTRLPGEPRTARTLSLEPGSMPNAGEFGSKVRSNTGASDVAHTPLLAHRSQPLRFNPDPLTLGSSSSIRT